MIKKMRMGKEECEKENKKGGMWERESERESKRMKNGECEKENEKRGMQKSSTWI